MALKIPPPILLLLFGAAVYLLDRAFPSGDMALQYQAQFYTSAFLALIALVLDLPAVFTFLANHTTVSPISPSNTTHLVTSGLYKFTRNPMYLGLVVMLLAWIIYVGNWYGLLLLPLFIVYLTQYQIIPEEEVLSQKFGSVYTDYQQRVRRWI